MRPRRQADDASAYSFGIRLTLACAVALVLVGTVGYALLDRQSEHRLVHSYALEQRSNAATFEAIAARSANRADMLREIGESIDSLAAQPDTEEVLLIDGGHVVRAAADPRAIGRHDSDERIEAALANRKSYEGREADPRKRSSDFEFLVPVDLKGERFVFEVTRGDGFLDAQLSDLRGTLALVGALALLLGGGAFYLVGGRPLMRSHRRVLERATRDGLTDLPNQRAFQAGFPRMVATASRTGDPLAVAVLDIDDFKFLNDRHGHAHGDALIARVADLLRAGRDRDRPFRVGGDEFALLMPGTDLAGAREVADRLSRALAQARISVSIGVTSVSGAAGPNALRGQADAAMYEAKRLGGNRAVAFADVCNRVEVITSERMLAVRQLIEEEGVESVFQPIWNLATGTLVGVEALSRPGPRFGFSGPAEVFDVAERIGRVHELDQLCVRTALRAAPDLPEHVLLFLNVSPSTLDLDADERSWLQAEVEAAGLTPGRVVVEVTERFGGRTASVVKSLLALRRAGFRLALDDVGAGNAGLEMLRRVDAEFVKIDRAIVAAAPTERTARGVLLAMATFAHHTGAFVIAEGIEDDDMLDFVRAVDDSAFGPTRLIQGGQGFGLGRPAQDLVSVVAQPGWPLAVR